MSGLLFLTSEDFDLQRGTKGNIMCHRIQGFSLILFYSTHCVHCQGLIPIFKSLPGTIGGCQFGMINVSNNRATVEMSKQSVTPIKYVPYIVLYFNMKPFMVYKGPYVADEIRRFIIEVANNIQKKQQFSKAQIKQDDQEGGIPAYTVGRPVCGDDKVCYLEFLSAYQK
uniref:Thioredoxin domain-containing protein n=1 Tax=viral metagenome TaxID=1070528 RepID=A0A6C0EKC1_9ZZZZ